MITTLLISILLSVSFFFLWRKAKDKYYEEKIEDISRFTDQMEVNSKKELILLKSGHSVEKYRSDLKYKLLEKLKKEKPSKNFIFHEMIMQLAKIIYYIFSIAIFLGIFISFYQWIQRVFVSGECTTYVFFEICRSGK